MPNRSLTTELIVGLRVLIQCCFQEPRIIEVRSSKDFSKLERIGRIGQYQRSAPKFGMAFRRINHNVGNVIFRGPVERLQRSPRACEGVCAPECDIRLAKARSLNHEEL